MPFRNEDDPKDDIQHEEFRSWLSDRLCPACGIAMYAGRKGKVGLEACGGCGGVWVSNEDAQHLFATKDAAFAAIAKAAVKGSEKRAAPKGPRRCPDCGNGLVEGWLDIGRVNVDVCASHGTWFDPHELVAVVEHLTQKPVGEFERPIELDDPFVAAVRRIYEKVKRRLGA